MIRKTARHLGDSTIAIRPHLSAPARSRRHVPSDEGELDVAECWRLLMAAGQGRLATSAGDWIELVAIDYLVHEARIVFRTPLGDGSEAPRRPEVAFEIDGEDSRWHWSVVVHGMIERIADDAELVTTAARRLASWCPRGSYAMVRLTPELIQGRRMARREFHRSSVMA